MTDQRIINDAIQNELNSPDKRTWSIHSWAELEEALAEMKPRSKLYEIVKAEMVKRNRWKAAPRGSWVSNKANANER